MNAKVSISGRLFWAVLLYTPAVLLLVSLPLAARITGNELSKFTLDPAALSGAHPFLGVLSNIGILIWAGTASISLFTAAHLWAKETERETAVLLLSAGILTSWLLLDDLFLLHEWLFPTIVGVPQSFVLAGYIGVMGLFLFRFGTVIMRTDYSYFAAALMFFALSMAVDQLPSDWFAWEYLYLIEDGAKLLGIVSWFAYFVGVCAQQVAAQRKQGVDQLLHI